MIGSLVRGCRPTAGGRRPTRPDRGQRALFGAARLLPAITCTLILLTCGQTLAAPACPDPLVLRQPDGTVLLALRGGDERLNWISVDGQLVAKGPDGFWRYLLIEQGVQQLATARAGLDAPPSNAATVPDAIALRQITPQPMEAPTRIHRTWGTSIIAAPRPTEPLLVLLVEFTDRTLETGEADWAAAFFADTGKTVRTYYREASRHRFWFEPAAESYGTAGNGVVRVRLNCVHPNPGNKIGEANKRIVRDALVAANAYVDFAAFDTNGDGGISSKELHVATVVAGHDGGEAPSVWGHKGWLFDTVPGPTLDGVVVGDWYRDGSYVQIGELCDGHATPIGPICHELGHDIGLPDLYDLDGSSYGTGTHCLMSSGAWGATPGEWGGATPVLLSAWCRIKLGFVTPTIVSGAGAFILVQACDTASSNVLQILTSDPDEYFLVENRQPAGFDAGLSRAFQSVADNASGGGIAIWHVDESIDSNNNDETHKRVDLEEANELEADGSQLDRKDNWGSRRQYYYAGHAVDFNDNTTPSSRLYSGAATGITIGGISASGESMTLTVGASANVVISGCVKSLDGIGLGGVVLQGLPNNPVTDGDGHYMASARPGWSGTVRPTVEGRAFNPASRSYSAVTASRTEEDYIADTSSGTACPAAGFSPIILWTCLLAWLARPRTGRQQPTKWQGGQVTR